MLAFVLIIAVAFAAEVNNFAQEKGDLIFGDKKFAVYTGNPGVTKYYILNKCVSIGGGKYSMVDGRESNKVRSAYYTDAKCENMDGGGLLYDITEYKDTITIKGTYQQIHETDTCEDNSATLIFYTMNTCIKEDGDYFKVMIDGNKLIKNFFEEEGCKTAKTGNETKTEYVCDSCIKESGEHKKTICNKPETTLPEGGSTPPGGDNKPTTPAASSGAQGAVNNDLYEGCEKQTAKAEFKDKNFGVVTSPGMTHVYKLKKCLKTGDGYSRKYVGFTENKVLREIFKNENCDGNPESSNCESISKYEDTVKIEGTYQDIFASGECKGESEQVLLFDTSKCVHWKRPTKMTVDGKKLVMKYYNDKDCKDPTMDEGKQDEETMECDKCLTDKKLTCGKTDGAGFVTVLLCLFVFFLF